MDISSVERRSVVLGLIVILLHAVATETVSPLDVPGNGMRSSVSAGHICVETRPETSVENVTTYYSCLQSYIGTCNGWFWNSKNCTKLRTHAMIHLIKETKIWHAYRQTRNNWAQCETTERFKLYCREGNCSKTEEVEVTRNVSHYVCCEGWGRDDQFRCLVPVCKDGCRNGGTCVGRNGHPECECLQGYSGDQCQNKVNRCTSTPAPCEQVCVNTPTGYTCECVDGFTLAEDKKSCVKNQGSTEVPVSGYLASPKKKRSVGTKTVYVLVAVTATLLIILTMSLVYLIRRRKERLAMESILKDRVALSVNDYSNPAFGRLSNEITANHQNLLHPDSVVYSVRLPGVVHVGNGDLSRSGHTVLHNQSTVPVQSLQGDISSINTGVVRISNTSSESADSVASTGWTNPLFLSAQEPENNRPATYAVIDEECYSGSIQSGIYTSIPERVTLEGFDAGETNDYDSFTSDESEQEAIYENSAVASLQKSTQLIKSVYLHTPSQSMQSLSIPIQEENNYEYVSDNHNSEVEYDYVANDDDIFQNGQSSTSSHSDFKQDQDNLYEDTDSPNTTFDTTAEEIYDGYNCHEYDYATNPKTNDYYEDGTSIDLQLNDLPDDYDYVSNADITNSTENIQQNNESSLKRQFSMDGINTEPTTYYDDITLLARKSNLENYGDLPDGELPEYEYVRNSNGTDCASHASQLSLHSLGDTGSRVSYASIDESDNDPNATEHDYDEIKRVVRDTNSDESEGEYDSDYERVSDVVNKIENNKVSSIKQTQDLREISPSDMMYSVYDSSGQNAINLDGSDYEPVYDDVCRSKNEEDSQPDR